MFLPVKAQEINQPSQFHQWGAVTIFNGLPSDNVHAVAQTPDGILWFATDAGLAKFDGRRVENVALTNLPSTKILSLVSNITGEIWIGTQQGAARIRDDKVYPIAETSGKSINWILPGEITVLVGGDAVFYAHHNPDDSLEITVSNAPNFQLSAAARDSDGKVFFGSKGRGIVAEESDFREVVNRPRSFFINTLKDDDKGNLFIGAQSSNAASGLFIAKDISKPVMLGDQIGTVNAIETSGEDIWIGTENNGLFHFRDDKQIEHLTFENTAGGLRSNKIYSVFSDREKVLWIGTNRGVCRFDPSSPFNQTLSTDANANFVRTLYRTTDGRLFAGTNRGLFLDTEGQWIAANFFSLKTVYVVGEDAAGQILIGTSTGVFSFDGKKIIDGDVRAIVNFQGKTYAAIFGRGVVRLDDQTLVFDDNAPTTIFADKEKLWIGTAQNCVFVFDGTNITQPPQFKNLRGGAIRKIVRDGKNNLWLSGERGLFVYRQTGEMQIVIADQDVRDADFTGADDVWATTLKNGLVHLRDDPNFGWLVSDLNVEQGLPSEQIFSILPLENQLLVGTNRGIVSYTPSSVAPQIVPVRVISQKLYAPQEIASEIKLAYPQNSLLVEVAGLSSRTFPEQFQYSFFLKNSKGEILDKKLSNEAQFSAGNLAAGEYEIEARSFNKDLLASEPLIIKFSVARAPFPWTATWLGILLTIALIALIWAVLERRRITERNRELAAARFDLANEAERERKRIARDLHDQTLADLRALMLKSDKLPIETNEFRTEIESVSTEIRRICEDLSPSVLENVGLTPALEFLLAHTIPKWEFTASENAEEKITFTSNEQMQIYRIAQEVLNNIKRHSDAAFVIIKVEVGDHDFILRINDNGTFFHPPETSAKGQRGIANIKSRAALVKAEAAWEESDGGGTVFTLSKQID